MYFKHSIFLYGCEVKNDFNLAPTAIVVENETLLNHKCNPIRFENVNRLNHERNPIRFEIVIRFNRKSNPIWW